MRAVSSVALTSKPNVREIPLSMSEVASRVRERREGRGLSQIALAERTGLTRQSIGAIEAGRATPSVDVALRIAAALDCLVEDLFGQTRQAVTIVAESYETPTPGRNSLARIAGRWVCYPLDEAEAVTSADGIVAIDKANKKEGRVHVSLLRAVPELEENVVLMGCALGLGLLANRLNSRDGAGRFLWLSKSSAASLEALAAEHTHLAGVHLADPRTGEANVPDVRRVIPKEPLKLVALGRWEAGLLVRRGAGPVRRLSDLMKPGVRFVGREAGAGAQRLLEREARGQGLAVNLVRKPHVQVKTPMDVGRAVALGAADVGPATRDVALSLGLDFIPVAEERFDLVLTPAAFTDGRLQRLFDVLTSAEFRRELTELGYDMRCAGDRVAEVNVP